MNADTSVMSSETMKALGWDFDGDDCIGSFCGASPISDRTLSDAIEVTLGSTFKVHFGTKNGTIGASMHEQKPRNQIR